MSGWERGAKYTVKAVLWVSIYMVSAVGLGLNPSWQLIAFVFICEIWSRVLDWMIPTAGPSTPTSTEAG